MGPGRSRISGVLRHSEWPWIPCSSLVLVRLWSDENFSVLTGRAQGFERSGGFIETEHVCHQQLGTGHTTGQALQSGRVLSGGIAEGEAEFQLLGYGEERLDRIGVHTHADHHDAAARRGLFDDALQHAGHTYRDRKSTRLNSSH